MLIDRFSHFSIIFSSAIIMEGYDTLLLGQFYAQPAFARVRVHPGLWRNHNPEPAAWLLAEHAR